MTWVSAAANFQADRGQFHLTHTPMPKKSGMAKKTGKRQSSLSKGSAPSGSANKPKTRPARLDSGGSGGSSKSDQ